MRGYLAFVHKEIMEYIRSYKFLILLIAFFILGFMNPPVAKFAPALMAEFMPEGVVVDLPEVTVIDSWMQFYKNVPQIGILVFVIVFSGLMANECSRGTLINLLTKGLNRRTVILAKFTAAGSLWSLCFFSAYVTTLLYNNLFWRETEVSHSFFAAFCVWVFGCFILSCLILGGTLILNSFGGMLVTVMILIGFFILNMLPHLSKYNPIRLVTVNMQILTNQTGIEDVYTALGTAGALIICMLTAGVWVLYRKKL